METIEFFPLSSNPNKGKRRANSSVSSSPSKKFKTLDMKLAGSSNIVNAPKLETIEFFHIPPNPEKGKRPVDSSVSSSPSKKFKTLDMKLTSSTGSSSIASSSNSGNAGEIQTGPVNIRIGPVNLSTDLCIWDCSWRSVKIENAFENNSVSRKLLNLEAIDISKKQRELEFRSGISTELGLSAYPWSIKKKLTESDLGNLSRLIINKELVDNHVLKFLPEAFCDRLDSKKGGVLVQVWDHDTDSSYQMNFKRWNSSMSYVLNGVWNKEFVKRRGLRKDDVIGLCWDSYEFGFCFCVLERAAVTS